MKARILIIDDTKLGRLSVRKILSKIGISDIEEMTDGSALLERLQRGHISLVLMDVLMPGKNGMEVLEEVRNAGLKTPIVMVSADIQHSTRERCLAAGANGFLNKPVKSDLLEDLLKELELL